MRFNQVIGQEDVKTLLRRQADEGRVPHALLLSGPSGVGKLSMAVALASYLLCPRHHDGDSCGECPQCSQIDRMSHPDLHFSFPVIRTGSATTCADYQQEWRAMTQGGYYFGLDDWLAQMGADNKQALITEAESDRIISRMSLSSYEGGLKVMIVWLPERMNAAAANNLLKTLEEPSEGTVFILVSDAPDQLLSTIISRTQQIPMRPLSSDTITQALTERNGIDREAAMQVARLSQGSYLRALQLTSVGDTTKPFFDHFTTLMRAAYNRDLVTLRSWSDELAGWGRERLKAFLGYCQNMVRENFIYNFHRPELNYMSPDESKFATRFARFINERNVLQFCDELSHAQRDIEQNVNARSMLFDFALHCVILIRR